MNLKRLAALIGTAALTVTLTPFAATTAHAATIPQATVAAAPASTEAHLPPGMSRHVDQSCTGTGTDGPRVQAMYVREADQPDRYAEVLPDLVNELRYIDDVFALSAKKTNGGKRVRWTTNPDCTPNIANVVLPDGAITGTMAKTQNALQTAGLWQPNRKYLVFADVTQGGMTRNDGSTPTCGQATTFPDDSLTDNANDGRNAQMARVDRECWTTTKTNPSATALHEFVHTLGAVHPGAPHGTEGGHCTDEADVMCYPDGTATVTQVCEKAHEALLDCNNDDYFHTNPPAGSYLATHWNVANSPFLDTVPALADGPALAVEADTLSAETGDVVTFTADTPPGATVAWATDVPACETTGAPRTGNTFTVQCFRPANLTVTAVVSDSGHLTSTAAATVAIAQGPYPSLHITKPDSAGAGNAFTLTAEVRNAKTEWTYRWQSTTSGCKTSGGTTAILTVTCTSIGSADFGVTATRTADGTTQYASASVNVTDTGTYPVYITGPDKVAAGEIGIFRATSTNARDYQWFSTHGYVNGRYGLIGHGDTFVVNPPQNARSSTETVSLDVTFASGKSVSVRRTYTVEGKLDVTVTGPEKLDTGKSAVYVATVTKPATVAWDVDQPSCTITPVAGDPKRATLRCTEAATAMVTASAKNGEETATGNTYVTVTSPAPPAAATSLTFTSAGAYPTTITGVLKTSAGKPVVGRTVRLERSTASGWALARNLTSDATGKVTTVYPVTIGADYRLRFAGDTQFKAATSTARLLKAYTKMTLAAKNGYPAVLTATLRRGNNTALASRTVQLERRPGTTGAFTVVKRAKTNTSGKVAFKVNVTAKGYYRVRYLGSGTEAASTSPTRLVKAYTKMTLAATQGYPSVMTTTLRRGNNTALASRTVQLERRPGTTGAFKVVKRAKTNAKGTVKFKVNVTAKGYYRVRYLGNAGEYASTSPTRLVKVHSKLGHSISKNRLYLTVRTGWGRALQGATVSLQQRRVGTSKWSNVRNYRTNKSGVVAVHKNPARATDYRWRYAGNATYYGGYSRALRRY